MPLYVSSPSDTNDHASDESYFKDKVSATSLTSSVRQTKKKSKAIKESSAKKTSFVRPRLSYERHMIISVQSNFLPP